MPELYITVEHKPSYDFNGKHVADYTFTKHGEFFLTCKGNNIKSITYEAKIGSFSTNKITPASSNIRKYKSLNLDSFGHDCDFSTYWYYDSLNILDTSKHPNYNEIEEFAKDFSKLPSDQITVKAEFLDGQIETKIFELSIAKDGRLISELIES